MAYEQDPVTGLPPRNYSVVEDRRSNAGLIAVAVIVLALLLAVFSLVFSQDHRAPVQPTEPAATQPSTAPADPVVPDAVPSTAAPDATPDATAPSGAESDIGDPTVPGIPAEDAAPQN